MTERGWARLAKAVDRRLGQTGETVTEVARSAGLSRETVRPILNGVPGNYRPSTMAKVSIALGWTGESIESVLNGGSPVVARQRGDRLDAVEQRLDRIEEALQRLLDGTAAP